MIVPLFGTGQQGKSSTATAQRHLNLYAEANGDKGGVTFYGTPGLALFASMGETPIRGMLPVGDFLYVVHVGTLWRINNVGAKTYLGTLATSTGRVDLAYNGSQIVLTDGSKLYCFTVATSTFATVTSGLFTNPVSVTFQDSYFIASFYNSQQFQISGNYNGTTWNALDFASAESNPDNVQRVIADHGELVICGNETVEFWGNSGAADFPFSAIRGATAEFGLVAPWSLTKYNDALAGLFRNKMGQVQVMIVAGHAMKKISSPEVDYLINNYAAVTDATGFSYMLGGHPMYQINFPTAGKSWLYDASTDLWSELESGGARHRAEIHANYLGLNYVSDYSNGNIYLLSADTYTDNGTNIAREIRTRHYFQNYQYVAVHKLQVDFETGVGLSDTLAPQAMLQFSKDNGHTWSNELWTSMGKVGTFLTRAIWRRLGAARDWVFKLRITDPVKVVITGASLDAEARQ